MICGKGNGARVTNRNFKKLCQGLGTAGAQCAAHTMRHTIAVGDLRKGGNIDCVPRIHGNTNIGTPKRYQRSPGLDD